MAGRSHQQLRFWALIVLALVATVIAGGHLWKRQLPERLRQAFRAGDLLACMHYSEQLTALQWLNPEPPRELALCRRAMALRHWQNGDPAAALALQQDLINSSSGEDLLQQQDQRQLLRWRNELLSKAMSAFKTGEIDAAIRLLEPLDAKDATAGGKLSDQWKESWERNRLEHQRLQRLVKQESWWEALGSLNRLDHPWWQQQTASIRKEVEAAIASIDNRPEHTSHGDGPTHTVPELELNAAVNQRIEQGMEAWSAFEAACTALGGRVVEAGPETICQR